MSPCSCTSIPTSYWQQIYKPWVLNREQRRQPHLIHSDPWHASQALMSEYVMVLQSHKFEPWAASGPT